MSYDSRIAQTLKDLSGALGEGAELLGEDTSRDAGNAHSDHGSSVEQRDGPSSGHPRPSTSQGVTTGGGKGKSGASEPRARDDAASPGLSYDDQGVLEPKSHMDGTSEQRYRTSDKSRPPSTKGDKSRVSSDAGDETDYKGLNDGQSNPGRQSPYWSDWEDDGDIGPVPRFEDVRGEDLRSQQSVDEYIHDNNVTHRKRQDERERDRQYILGLKNVIHAREAEIETLRESLDRQRHRTKELQGIRDSHVPGDIPRYTRASSQLPPSSTLKMAMNGGDTRGISAPPFRQSSEPQTTRFPSHANTAGPTVRLANRPRTDDDLPPDILDFEPESDHDSDSKETRRLKSEARRRHRAQVRKLQYQAQFAKADPPFVYGGEVQASTFKRWCREIRGWVDRSYFSERVGIELSGKYRVL